MCDPYAIRSELSAPADMSPAGVSRRRFLQYALAGAAVAGTGVSLGFKNAFGGEPLGADGRVLVLIELVGGNDGLNTVAPVGSGRYRDLRGGLAVDPAQAHRIDDELAFHPALPEVARRYEAGDVAVVQGIGYSDSTLSHFDSIALWMAGQHGLTPGDRPRSGWIGRYLDALGPERSDLHAVAFSSSVPLHLRGMDARAITLRTGSLPEFGTATSASWRRMYDAVRRFNDQPSPHGPWADALADAGAHALDVIADIGPAYDPPLPGSGFPQQMVQAARLVNLDVGVRVLSVRLNGFDNHRQHEWDHGVVLGRLDKGITDFYSALDPAFADRVTLMTFSEFGRRPRKNGSDGTDHGAASVALVVGEPVVGGLYGEYPSLDSLDRRGNLVPTVDFRDLYGTVASAWLGADGVEIVGGGYEGLSIFGAAPDGSIGSVPPAPLPPSPADDEVSEPAPAPIARQGYLAVTSAGRVYNYGRHASFGSALVGDAVTVSRNPAGDGYWVASGLGAVRAYGDASDHGGVAHLSLRSPVVALAPTPTGDGYWLAGADGGVFALGGAPFRGGLGGLVLAAPVVGLAAHPTGDGYWLCGADGGVFALGAAPFRGSAAHLGLVSPVVGMAGHPSGDGYWLLTGDGGVFAFGAAPFRGSLVGLGAPGPATDLAPTPSGDGYWLACRDGRVFAFGDAVFHGAPLDQGVLDDVVSITG